VARPLVVLLAAAFIAAGAAAALLSGGGSPRQLATSRPALGSGPASAPHAFVGALVPLQRGQNRALAPAAISSGVALPAPSQTRAQRYGASLTLRLPDGAALAAASRRAVAIADALGGYPRAVEVSVAKSSGSATIVLAVPRSRVTEAISRLSALGTVVGEHVAITDLQGGVDATGLRIMQLERALDRAIHAPSSVREQRLVAALTAQIVGLQRTRAATLRSAYDATVSLHLATPAARPLHHARRPPARPGPFHELGVAFRFAGIAAVYALALGTPLGLLVLCAWLVAVRLRRRRDERLLSRS
jgi:hypothetical protein